MRKLKLDPEALVVESFAAVERAGEVRGTVRPRMEAPTEGCPTNFCVTYPLLCPTFRPTCAQNTADPCCTGAA